MYLAAWPNHSWQISDTLPGGSVGGSSGTRANHRRGWGGSLAGRLSPSLTEATLSGIWKGVVRPDFLNHITDTLQWVVFQWV